MTELINPGTDKMTSEGFTLAGNELVRIDIVRSLFDGKLAGILSGAGGASCQLYTATHSELKDRQIVLQGFPINGIPDAKRIVEMAKSQSLCTTFSKP